MGLFDKMKQATAATGGNQTVTFTFQALPESLAQMQALPEASLDTPFKTAALTVCALCAYGADKNIGKEMLNWLRGPRPLNGQDISFLNDRFRVYSSSDVVGVELGAALKNVMALCTGCCTGMGYGDNTKALLMTRGLAEMARLGVALGGRKETFTGLAGVGGLIVTCTSMHSRNRRCGILIGQGAPAAEAVKEIGAVVEGYYAAATARALAQKAGVEMPIAEAAYQVLYGGRDTRAVIKELMTRARKHELEDSWV